MDRFQLYQDLRAAGVPEAYYEIPDCSHGPHLADHLISFEDAPGFSRGRNRTPAEQGKER